MTTKIKFVLTISIILNFLFVGLLIGNASKNYVNHQEKKNYFEEITKNLPPEKKKNVLSKVNELKDNNMEKKMEIFKKRAEISEILKAEEFNEKLYDEKISEMQDIYREKAKNLAKSIKELAMQFTPEERAVLAEMIEKKHKRHWHKDDN